MDGASGMGDAGRFVRLFTFLPVLPKNASNHKNQQILSFQQNADSFFSIKAWKM
jgi:hypothetical protein